MIRQAIDQINDELISLEREKFALQEKCKHPKTFFMDHHHYQGRTSRAEVCACCDKILRYV